MNTITAALRQIKDLPRPRGWPLLGNMFQLKPSRIHQDVEGWAREFGPLFRFRVGLRNVLMVSGHELLTGAMRDRPDGFRRSPRTVIVATELGLPGRVQRRRRGLAAPAAHGHGKLRAGPRAGLFPVDGQGSVAPIRHEPPNYQAMR